MPDQNQKIVVAGHICLDIIPIFQGQYRDLKNLFVPGKLIAVGPATISGGGVVSNTGLALHRLGVPTRLIGKLGDDALGRMTLDVLRSHDPGLVEGMIVAEGEASSYTVVINPPGVDRMFFHFPGQNDTLEASDIADEQLGDVALFHFGYPPILRRMYREGGRQLTLLFQRVKAQGVTTSLDMAMPDPNSEAGQVDWAKILARTLPFVDLFLPSLEETLFMLERETYNRLQLESHSGEVIRASDGKLLNQLAEHLLKMGAAVIGFKLGDQGFYVRTADNLVRLSSLGRGALSNPQSWRDRELLAPCFEVEVAGTTGAGDCSNAGFLTALLQGMSPEEAITYAVAVGAHSVENAKAAAELPDWENIKRRVQSGWEQKPVSLSLPGWRWDAKARLWVGPKDRTS